MINYTVIESTIDYLKNITCDMDFSENKVGDNVFVFGQTMKITQLGGGVVGMSNNQNIVVFQENINTSV